MKWRFLNVEFSFYFLLVFFYASIEYSKTFILIRISPCGRMNLISNSASKGKRFRWQEVQFRELSRLALTLDVTVPRHLIGHQHVITMTAEVTKSGLVSMLT